MAKARVLAFLLCENATRNSDGKVTLHGLFDRIIMPRSRRDVGIFFVYYKVVVDEPCTVTLRVVHLNQLNSQIQGPWRDSFSQLGPVQSIWAITTSLFREPGPYEFELRQESEGSEPLSLATMRFVVDQQGE